MAVNVFFLLFSNHCDFVYTNAYIIVIIMQEKEQRKLKTTKQARSPSIFSTPIGNKHNVSDYFNKCLDDIVPDLKHMVPLFVERCVTFLDRYGEIQFYMYIPVNYRH